MNFKSNILTICLTAFALLAPQKAFGLDHQIQKEVHYLCVREAKDSFKCVENQEDNLDVQKNKKTESSTSLTDAKPALNTNGAIDIHNQYSHTHIYEVLIIVVFVSSLSLWLFLYISHRKNRVAVMRQNIEALEKLWKISNYQ